MEKIKRIWFMSCWILVILLLLYSRFINLSWGLPHPLHPDERNMSIALQQLQCSEFSIKNCFNPHFFAYGQLPLYLGYLLIMLGKLVGLGWLGWFGRLDEPIGFVEATMALRLISAIASVVNALVLYKIVAYLNSKLQNPNNKQIPNYKIQILKILLFPFSIIIITFTPFFIQFSHFGTTESLLMLFYSVIIYLSLLTIQPAFVTQFSGFRRGKAIVLLGLFSGLSLATKVSSLPFLAVPVIAILFGSLGRLGWLEKLRKLGVFGVVTWVVAILGSPHNLISFSEFISSMRFESAVGLGSLPVFYTRTFISTIPILFQFTHIFPYALGWPLFALGLLGMLGGLTWRSKEINLLRIAFLAYFLPNAFVFAKWTRFMAPVFPIMMIFAILFMRNVVSSVAKNLAKHNLYFPRSLVVASLLFGMTGAIIIPGISYLSIYQNPDVRFTASEWIYKNIPAGSYILSETANVIDIPITNPNNSAMKQFNNYQYISFNFYDVDEDPFLQYELKEYVAKADYIIVPSRRVFMNHTCLQQLKIQNLKFKSTMQNAKLLTQNQCEERKKQYSILNEYYEKLFSGELGYKQVAEFDSFPQLCLLKVGCWKFDDESSEETWTVFDHPVIRIFQRKSVNSS